MNETEIETDLINDLQAINCGDKAMRDCLNGLSGYSISSKFANYLDERIDNASKNYAKLCLLWGRFKKLDVATYTGTGDIYIDDIDLINNQAKEFYDMLKTRKY